ncbi:ABC transporter ATP-binding protein [Gordonia sp. L191]|uniref:ABC transporter ATP-binding protein n=1 Tax=Gordonia sp. L191 TaxID=2982699 RepID=UPI0024C04636|nr:ABC transporter ATP-binding protein [Gordonia sp. L191]WHU47715.1 ABC transporter ATP-binding protein [Gordonia sp. L191]
MTIDETPQRRLPRLSLLLSLVAPFRGKLILALVLGLGATGSALATPLAIKRVLDSVSGHSDSTAVAVGVLVALLVVGATLALCQWVLLGTLAEEVVLKARISLITRFFRATVQSLSGRSSGELVTRVTSDTTLLREAGSSSLIHIVNSAIAIAGSVVVMAFLDVTLLAVTAGAVVVVGFVVAVLMPRIAVAQQSAQSALGSLGGRLEGGLRAIRTVKIARAEQREIDRLSADAEESARQGIRAVRIEAIAWTVAGSGIQFAVILVLAFGAWRVEAGALAVSSLVAFLLYAFQLVEPVTEMTTNVTQLQAGIAAAGRIGEAREIDVEHGSISTGTAPTTRVRGGRAASAAEGPTVLEFRGVGARYQPQGPRVLDGIDLSIGRSGHVAIVGPSGSGKTTMMSLMLRFLEPSEGQLLLDGQPYEALSFDAVRRRFGYVEQDTPVIPGTVRDNLAVAVPDAADESMRAALEQVGLAERVQKLRAGLDTEIAATTLSGGERQRLSLARALMGHPEILLLDEATAQLDGRTEAAVHAVIERIARDRAVVTIAHRLSTVIDADEIVVLEHGRIRARGTHRQLVDEDALYRELVAALRIAV